MQNKMHTIQLDLKKRKEMEYLGLSRILLLLMIWILWGFELVFCVDTFA